MHPPIYVRVTKDAKNNCYFELMHNGEKIADVSCVELVEIASNLVSALRFRDGVK